MLIEIYILAIEPSFVVVYADVLNHFVARLGLSQPVFYVVWNLLSQHAALNCEEQGIGLLLGQFE